MMDRLWAMEVFVRVAECGSFSRAAESLNLANATVTASVRNLERHLKVALISRDTRRLRLTGEGELLLVRAREFIESLSRMEDEVRSQANALSGTLHVSVPVSLGQKLLAPALPEFAKQYPDITVTVTLTNHPHNLIERAIDVSVRLDHVEDADLVARPLFVAEYLVCGMPELVRSLPEHPSQLDPKLCLSMLPGEGRHPISWNLQRGDEKVTIQPRGQLHFNNADAVLSAAKSGIGLAYVLDVYAMPYLEAGYFMRAYSDWTMHRRPCFLVTTKDGAHSAKVRAFTQFVMEALEPARRPSQHASVPVKPGSRRG